MEAENMNLDQTASMGADCSGSILFAVYYATEEHK